VADPGFGKGGGGPWRARGARAYNGGLGAEPPAGSRDRAPVGGQGGRSPPEAESFLSIFILKMDQKMGQWGGRPPGPPMPRSATVQFHNTVLTSLLYSPILC